MIYLLRVRLMIRQSTILCFIHSLFIKGNDGTTEKSVANNQPESVHSSIAGSSHNSLLFFDFHDAAGNLYPIVYNIIIIAVLFSIELIIFQVQRLTHNRLLFLYFQIIHKLEVCFNEQNKNATEVLVVENPIIMRESTCQLLFNVIN